MKGLRIEMAKWKRGFWVVTSDQGAKSYTRNMWLWQIFKQVRKEGTCQISVIYIRPDRNQDGSTDAEEVI